MDLDIIDEISGLTFNDMTGEFFVVADGGELGRRNPGNQVWTDIDIDEYNSNTATRCDLSIFSDVEAITYMGSSSSNSHQYAIADERDRSIVFVDVMNMDVMNGEMTLSYPNSYLTFEGLGCGGNDGIEGIAYDASTNTMYFAIEVDDQIIYSFTVPANITGQEISDMVLNEVVNLRTVAGLSTYSTHGLDVMPNGNIVALVTEPAPGDDNGLYPRKIVEFDPCGTFLGEVDLEPTIPDTNNEDEEGADTAELEGIVVVGDFIYVTGEFGHLHQLARESNNLVSPTAKSVELPSDTRELKLPANALATEVTTTIYPNPFTDNVKVELDLITNRRVRIDVVDLEGKLVKTAVDQNDVSRGSHVFEIEANNLNSGLYFIRIQAGDFVETKKITKL